VMGAATAFRVGASLATLWSKEAPALLNLWLKAGEDDGAKHEAALRTRLFDAAKETTKRTNAEVLGGIDDVERFTRRATP
jgi:hypothetical protein